jgi:hypothetical protein
MQFKVSPTFSKQIYCSRKCYLAVKPPNRLFYDKLKEGKRTSIETLVENALIVLDEPYEWEHRFGQYYVDFYLPLRKVALECDEPYWHDQEKDKRKDNYILERYNIPVIRLTTAQIKSIDLTKFLKASL